MPVVSSDSSFSSTGVPARPAASQAKASEQAARRVLAVSGKLFEANRQTGVRPSVHTLGSTAPEVFHRGTSELFVTEGLSRQCKTDGQLAAVLAVQLGKMVAEREALAVPGSRAPDRLPPIDARVGTDSGGAFSSADGTRLVELSEYEKQRPKRGAAAPPPPDPMALARTYLERAGYTATDLDEAAPVLKAARANVDLEKQLKGTGVVRPWTQ
jgi:hypothetical protein